MKAAEPCEYERNCTLVYDCELVGLPQVSDLNHFSVESLASLEMHIVRISVNVLCEQ